MIGTIRWSTARTTTANAPTRINRKTAARWAWPYMRRTRTTTTRKSLVRTFTTAPTPIGVNRTTGATRTRWKVTWTTPTPDAPVRIDRALAFIDAVTRVHAFIDTIVGVNRATPTITTR
jgi:hypothetical protein